MSEPNKQPKARNFRLALVDDLTHRQLGALRFTRSNFIVLLSSVIVVIMGTAFALFALTPLKTVIPGYPDAHTRMAAVQNAIKIDSLESVISRWEFYTENLLNVLEGSATMSVDSLLKMADANDAAIKDPQYLASRDSALRAIVDEAGQFVVNGMNDRQLPIEGMHFFTPLKGSVITPYDEVLHPFVDLKASSNSVVMAVLPGTVIYDGWSDGTGYVIAVQHENDIVSIYKNNQKLLRKRGDKVTAGSSIAIVGTSDDSGDHLHFELWYNGAAVNPADYINF